MSCHFDSLKALRQSHGNVELAICRLFSGRGAQGSAGQRSEKTHGDVGTRAGRLGIGRRTSSQEMLRMRVPSLTLMVTREAAEAEGWVISALNFPGARNLTGGTISRQSPVVPVVPCGALLFL
eukprot:Skav210894  [mRNA]  locus=scaffold1060:84971:85339:- [translate_table: standard]